VRSASSGRRLTIFRNRRIEELELGMTGAVIWVYSWMMAIV